MLPRLNDWVKRIHFPPTSRARLGFAGEYWNSKPEQYEGWQQLRHRLITLGRKPSRHHLAYELAGHLLDDVIVAAGGAECALAKLRTSLEDLDSYVTSQGIRAEPGLPSGLSHDAAIEAWYAFADLLSWTRTVVERVDRPPGGRKNFPRQGLLHAIKPKRLKVRCQALLDELRHGAVGQTRLLTNFMLHSALVRHPMTGVQVDASGSVSLPIPDLPQHPVSHWYLLTWNTVQDGFSFAEALWKSLERFIDELLAAFEKATPKRLRKALLTP